jgi:hypothetical protein
VRQFDRLASGIQDCPFGNQSPSFICSFRFLGLAEEGNGVLIVTVLLSVFGVLFCVAVTAQLCICHKQGRVCASSSSRSCPPSLLSLPLFWTFWLAMVFAPLILLLCFV